VRHCTLMAVSCEALFKKLVNLIKKVFSNEKN